MGNGLVALLVLLVASEGDALASEGGFSVHDVGGAAHNRGVVPPAGTCLIPLGGYRTGADPAADLAEPPTAYSFRPYRSGKPENLFEGTSALALLTLAF